MSSKSKTVIILLLVCILIAVIPLATNKNGSEFGGADGAASEIIEQTHPSYKVWTDPVLEPPGAETESLLFCLQASLGAGVFGYCIGVLRERSKHSHD